MKRDKIELFDEQSIQKIGSKYIFKHNLAHSSEDFYISYNFMDNSVYGDVTTAIVIGQMQRFYILTGNHYDELKQCKTFDEAINYFLKNAKDMNKMSDRYDEIDANNVILGYKRFKESFG